MELTYRTEGDYRLPNLEAPEAPKVGKYGMLRRSYLQTHRNAYYTGMLLSGRLNAHLEKIDRQATEMVEQLTARGYTGERIAAEFYISKSTVDTHLRRIYAKCGVHGRQELIDLGERTEAEL